MQNNNNTLQVFNFKNADVRAENRDGEPIFIVNDICAALDIANPRNVMNRLDERDVYTMDVIDSLGRSQHMNAVNESGLYQLIFMSRKPEAREFKHWVTSEVLPSIRRHGAYMTEDTLNKALTSPDFLIQLATQLKESQERVKAQQAQLEAQAPKVLFADAVSASDGTCLVGELAKMMTQAGFEIGQNRLFKLLREDGYLGKSNSNFNVPKQVYIERGLFKIKETAVTHADGHVTLNRTPKVTGRGQTYFLNKYAHSHMEVSHA